MSRRLTRISLVLVFLLSSEVWAIGLGDIRLDSALNEPLRAEIELLSATPEELANLTVTLASAETFERYGIDRPYYLQELAFRVDTGPNGAVVQIRSPSPITEPFLTFLVEATWSAGRLLREYTVLLDPPTYSPPAVQQTPAIEAPRRATPTDSARIERQPPPPQPQPEPEPVYTPPTRQAEPPTRTVEEVEEAPSYETPAAEPSYPQPYSTTTGGDYYVERGDTLWGITSRLLPDGRLTMNQAMVAIFEANPEAFVGNINRLKAGVTLRIPSADSVFQIERATAFNEVKRMNEEWRGEVPSEDTTVADTTFDDTSFDDTTFDDTTFDEPALDEPALDDTTFEDDASVAEDTTVADDPLATDTGYDTTIDTTEPEVEPAEPETETSLTLVPPDEDPAGIEFDDEFDATDVAAREAEILEEISALEAADVPEQESLIEIRDNRLAELQQELAELRGEVPPAELTADDALFPDQEQLDAAEEEATPPTVVRTRDEPGLVDTILGYLTSFWTLIVAAIVLVAGLLFWFVRRGGGDTEISDWDTLDKDEIAQGALTATETLQAPTPEDAIVVVEQDSGIRPLDDTIEAPEPDMAPEFESLEETFEAPAEEMPDLADSTGETGSFDALDDTFSSETAVNLDQTDPLAEADFHMAYGLYDQAADLINGALESDPGDQALMSKLCEIYFVWGNRDAFVDAASTLKDAVGDGDSAEWDKIVIMGQQIAGDHELFAGAGVAGATQAVDLSFEGGMDEAGELDMDFGGEATSETEVVDLGGEAEDASAIDFAFGEDDGEASAEDVDEAEGGDVSTIEMPDTEKTAEMPAATEPTVETPTIEEQFSGLDSTGELPSLDEEVESAIEASGQESDATAEINLDELDLDLDVASLAETELASLDDLDTTGTNEALTDTGDITGKNPEVDPDATGVQERLDPEATAGMEQPIDLDMTEVNDEFDIEDTSSSTGLHLAPDETGRMPTLDALVETDTTIDADLLDATGKTQVLSEDFAVETGTAVEEQLGDDDATMLAPGYGDEDADETAIASDAETLLAPMDDDEEDFDFAKTEALPPEAFTSIASPDETGEMPAVAGTDMDLDLDDLTAALQVSEVGDTVEQLRDDATVEQPRPKVPEEDATSEVPTMSLGPEDMSDDLHEARTMTEVGTKLDLARAYIDMGDPAGARGILEEVLDEGDEGQRQQAQQLLDTLPS